MKKILALCLPAVLAAAPLDSIVVREAAKTGYSNIQTIGFALAEKGSNTLLADFNSRGSFIPASVQKLFTGAAAMELLSPLHDFPTKIYIEKFDKATGASRNISVQGHGDPGFTAEQLWLMAYQLRMEGVTSLRDTLFVDNSFFDSVTVGPGFNESNSSRAYMAPVAALSVNFNSIAVQVRPTAVGEPAAVSFLPPQSSLAVKGSVKTTVSASKDDLNVTTFYNGKESVVSLAGAVGESDKSRIIYRKLWNPVQAFGTAFTAACAQAGITCSLTVVPGKVEEGNKPFYTFHSRPLQEHVKDMFKYSNNFVAEMVFRSIHAEKANTAGSWKGASEIVTNWYKGIASDTTRLPKILNGSGMGDDSRCSPSAVIDVLQAGMKSERFGPEFSASFPVAGEDGTLSSRFEKSPLKGNLRGKTGTLNDDGVTNLAGYFFKNGKTYLYCFLINNKEKTQYEHWMFQEHVLDRLYETLP